MEPIYVTITQQTMIDDKPVDLTPNSLVEHDDAYNLIHVLPNVKGVYYRARILTPDEIDWRQSINTDECDCGTPAGYHLKWCASHVD